MKDWMTPEMVKQSVRRNGIYLTQKDAERILSQFRQSEYYARHEGRVEMRPFDGKHLNGVDVTQRLPEGENDPKGNRQRNLAWQFLHNDTGLAYLVYVDGKLTGFQPHHPELQGWHSMSSKSIPCFRGHMHTNNCKCGHFHPMEEVMDTQKQRIVQGLASGEMQTRILYIAQEIYDRRMHALDRIAKV